MDITNVEKELLLEEKKIDLFLQQERGVIRLCSHAIKEAHLGNLNEAGKILSDAKRGMDALPEIRGRGRQIGQEYAEAAIVLSVALGKGIPCAKEVGVGSGEYLLGLMDAVGELKRMLFDALRKGDAKKADRLFALMEEIYSEAEPLHFSSALLPEFRRKQDVARIQLEDARGKMIK